MGHAMKTSTKLWHEGKIPMKITMDLSIKVYIYIYRETFDKSINNINKSFKIIKSLAQSQDL